MKLVLNAMVDTGYMTAAEANAIRTPRIDVRTRNTLPTGTYFADWALPAARKLSDVGYSRQTITTTLDARLQSIARRVTGRAGLGKAQVALVAMRPNGEVVAMIGRSEEHTSELQSLMRISYAVFCLKKKKNTTNQKDTTIA